jgi:hypothetical protein
MIFFQSYILLGFLISSIAFAGPTQKNDSSEKSGHIKYFGFFASDMSGLPEVAEEIQSFVNITHVADPDINEAIRKVKRAKSLKLAVIFDMSVYFYHTIKNSRNSYELNENYPERWNNEIYAKVRPYVEDGTIVAFYNLDEPFSPKRLQGKKVLERVEILEKVAKLLKDKFPLTPIALTLGGNSYDNYVIPKYHDWIGLDDYDCWEICTGGVSVPDRYIHLIKKLKQDQFVYLVPDAWKWAKGKPSSQEQAKMLELYKKYILFAKKEPKVIALFNFIYQDLDGFSGTTSAPVLKSFIQKIGSNFKSKTK